MNILAAHLNTSRATEKYLTILELADILIKIKNEIKKAVYSQPFEQIYYKYIGCSFEHQ